MDWRTRPLMAEAVFLFHAGSIVREMRYRDFCRAISSGRPLEPFVDETVHAAYVAVGDGLKVTAVCFFCIAVDHCGVPEADWNVPVRELAQNSGEGPALADGPIGLACQGQCAIRWHEPRLWRPELAGENTPLRQVETAVARNDLRLPTTRPRRDEAATGNARPAPDPAAPSETVAGAAQGLGISASASELTQRAAERLEAAFGPETARAIAHDPTRAGMTLLQLRDAHRAELAALQAAHDAEITRLKAEIRRLRQKLLTLGPD